MVRLVQNSFFGGQLDFEMMGRQDYQRYAKGATKLCNFNVMKRGGLDKRRGFDRVMNLVAELGVSASTKFRAIPFAYKKTHGFVLLMSSSRCIVAGTNPNNQFKYYTVDDLEGVYQADEIDELDYQQCGDILFIAHQNHKPARIVHDIDALGEHGFHYETIDLENTKRGIPSIVSAYGTRISVTTDDDSVQHDGTYGASQASLKTEYYKVTAVFDGVETRPSTAFSGNSNPSTKASAWNGTTYRMPWTESQKIALTINPATRTDEHGILVYPEEIRIYKKAFNYYGLIGTKKIDATATVKTGATSTNATTFSALKNSDDSSITDKFLESDAAYEVPEHGKDLQGRLVTDGNYLNVSFTGNIVSGYVRICLGNCRYTVGEGTVTFYYTGYAASEEGESVKVRIYKATTISDTNKVGEATLWASAGNKSKTVEQLEGETDDEFAARWADEYVRFCNSITDRSVINVPFSASNAAQVNIVFDGGDVAVANVKVFDTPAIGSLTFDDTYITPDASITPIDDGDDIPMSAAGDYPASVSLSQQRLIWASSKNDPQRIWMSAIGDFYSYEVHEIMVPDDAIDFQLPVTRFGKINHICEMRKLLLFNSACEWLVDSASTVQGLTYETIQAYPQSYSGSSERLKPIICNNSLIFCERTGQSVRRFAYDLSNDGFAGRDVSILSSSIFEFNSIVDWTYQQFPYSTLWCVMRDGTLASFEYMEEQDIMAWLTHRLGGNGKAVCVATSYAVSPAMDMIEDVNGRDYEYATSEEIFLVVRRTDDEGHDSLWLERMRPRTKVPTNNEEPLTDSLYHALCLDGCRVLNNTGNNRVPTDEKGAVWIPANTTTGAYITKAEAAAEIALGHDVYEGFPFAAEFVSVFPNVGNGAVGNGQFDISHVQGCALRLMHSFGGRVRPIGAGESEPIVYFYNDPENDHRMTFDGEGNVTLHNHDTHMMSLPGVNNRDGRVTVRQGEPYPFSVLSYEIDFETETGGPRR